MSQENINENFKKERYEDLIKYLIISDNPRLDEMCWIKRRIDGNYEKIAKEEAWIEKPEEYDKPISIRELILSQLTGKPIKLQDFIVTGDHEGVGFYTELTFEKDFTEEQRCIANFEIQRRKEEKEAIRDRKTSSRDKIGTISFRNQDGIKEWMYEYIPEFKDVEYDRYNSCEISVTREELLEKGLNPNMFGWTKEKGTNGNNKINHNDIAKVDKQMAISTSEVSGVKRFFQKVLDIFKGR